jgi:hypothetical protein
MRYLNRVAMHSSQRRYSIARWLLIAVVAVLTAGTVNETTSRRSACIAAEQDCPCDFVSLAKEAAFWGKWMEAHRGTESLDPFFYWESLQKPLDKKLVGIALHSKAFVLVIVANVNSGEFKVISVAKDDHWRQTNWELADKYEMKESVVTAPLVSEHVLKTLSSSPVFVASNNEVSDARSAFVFIKYQGKCNRLAVYDVGRVLREKAKNNAVAAALESLLQDTGVLTKGISGAANDAMR